MGGQEIIALIIVIATAVGLAVRGVRRWTNPASGCGGSCGCASQPPAPGTASKSSALFQLKPTQQRGLHR